MFKVILLSGYYLLAYANETHNRRSFRTIINTMLLRPYNLRNVSKSRVLYTLSMLQNQSDDVQQIHAVLTNRALIDEIRRIVTVRNYVSEVL